MDRPFFSVILPVHNQSSFIRSIVEGHAQSLSQLPIRYELLLVVNGSQDDSLIVCQKLSQDYPNIRVLESKMAGWGRAVKQGLQEVKGDIICYTNSSRTTTKDLTLFLLYAMANPGTVIKANRKIRESWIRRMGSLLYNIECRSLFDLSCWDINGTPKVFPRKFTKLLQLSREDDLIDLEFNCICRQEDYPIIEIPIFSTKRLGGRSTTGYHSAMKMYCGAFQLWRQGNHYSD